MKYMPTEETKSFQLLDSLLTCSSDTIRKMKNDFKKMEDEMDCLAANMAVITEFSASISSTLQDQHEQITKLSGRSAPTSVAAGL